MRHTALLVCLLLSACATPEQRCQSAIAKDLRTLDALIEETRLNISRGYTYVNEPAQIGVGIGFCTGYGGGMLFCGDNSHDVVRRPVAVDTAEEARKLASLIAKRDELQGAAYPALQSCISQARAR